MGRREWAPLLALAAILVITAAWWALALWPLPADAPAWLQTTRLVCFGAAHDTLPSAAGWSLLIGEPLAMVMALAIIWPRALAQSLRAAAATAGGRATLAATASLVLLGLGLAAGRVATAAPAPMAISGGAQRLDRESPPLGLVDQRGDTVTSAALRGRATVVVFAYAHCATVCPLIVHDALTATRDAGARLVIVTLDPWRDTPSRLPALALAWALPPGAHLLSGAVPDVARVLDAWGVPRTRDERTGEIAHATFAYVLDISGRVAWQVPSNMAAISAALHDL